MKVYIFEYIEGLTNNYHDSGGLVVVGRDALDVYMRKVKELNDEESEYSKYSVLRELPEPSAVFETTETEEHIYIFPDAGCC